MRALSTAAVEIVLVDRTNHHLFQPLLYQVATAQLAGGDIMRPLRGLFRKLETVDVKQAEVTAIDPVAKTVKTAEGHEFAGTHLVLAMGTTPNFFGVTGAAEHALPLYSADDAVRLRNRILRLFEDADLDAAATKAAGQYDDAGQVCLAGTRLLIQSSIRDDFLARFHAAVDRHALGDPRDDATTIAHATYTPNG